MILNRNDKWIEDIDLLAMELPKRHKKLFFSKDKQEFFKEIESLKTKVSQLEDEEIKVNLAKIVASIMDAHTSFMMQVNFLCPLELYWFSDDLYVTAASEEYKEIENCKITKVDGKDINEVIENLSSIVSHENESFLKAQLPKYFPAIEILYGLEIVDSTYSLQLTVEDRDKKVKVIQIEAFPISETREKMKKRIEKLLNHKNLPLYRKSPHKNYWFEYIEDFKTVYFKYNACRLMEDKSMLDFGKEMINFIKENQVEKLIIDLRNNSGGNSTFLEPFIDELKILKEINRKGNLFIIVGRETFSSALLNVFYLKENTNAIFLGEPTGGKPNCYGEVERFVLKNSPSTVCYSTKYYKIIADDNLLSFYPDTEIQLTIENYINKEDPCLNYVLKFK